MIRGWVGLTVLLVLPACVSVTSYTCGNDDDCRRGGRQGWCERNGRCSYADGECPDGRRYSDLAGAAAGACVSLTSTSSESASETGATTDGSGGESTDSGAVQWAVQYPEEGAGLFRAVQRFDEQTVVAVGDDGPGASIGLYATVDGQAVWVDTPDEGPEPDIAYDVAVSSGRIYAAMAEGTSPRTAAVYCYDASGGSCGRLPVGGEDDQSRAIGLRGDPPDSIIVGFHAPGSIGATGLDPDGNAIWEDRLPWNEPEIRDTLECGVTVSNSVFLGGTVGLQMWIARADGALVPHFSQAGGSWEASSVTALVALGAAVGYAGYVEGEGLRHPAVGAVDLAGESLWASEIVDVSGEALAAATSPSGEVYAVGFILAPAAVPWVSKWSPDGELLWHRSYPEMLASKGIARGAAALADGDLIIGGELTDGDGRDAFLARLGG